jgi:S-layer homology domain
MAKNKSYRKLVAGTMTAAMVASVVAPVSSLAADVKFTDVPAGHWSATAINEMAAKGIIAGEGNGKFGFGKDVTRGQVATFMVKAKGLQNETATHNFADVKGSDYEKFIAIAAKNGIMSGLGGDKFGTNDKLTRAQMAQLLVNAYGFKADENNKKTFSDIDGLGWATAKSSIETLASLGLVSGKGEGKFHPNATVTREEAAQFIYNAMNYTTEAKVESVKAINGKELVVVFNKAVDKVEAETASNFKLNDAEIGTPVLSEDGKTVTITTAKPINVKDAVLNIAPLKLKGDATKSTKKYVTLFTYSDTVAPSVSKVEAKDGKAVITFDEELTTDPGVSVNGNTYADFKVDGKKLTINGLENDKSYNVELVGAKDAADNLANPINLGFTVAKPDAVQSQAVSVSVKENKVTLSFVNALSDKNVAKVDFKDAKVKLPLDGKDADGIKYSEDKKTVVIDVQATKVLDGVNFLTTDIEVSGAGLVKAATSKATLNADMTAAKLVASQTNAKGKLVLQFNEEVKNPATLDLKVNAIDGIYQSQPATWTEAVEYAKDAKGKEIKNTLEVTLDKAEDGKNYTVEVSAAITDVYGNKTDKFTVSAVKPATDSTVKPGSVITVAQSVKKNVITLKFDATNKDKGVTSEALVAANYTLGGKALPTGTEIRYVDDKKNVEIVLPEGAIKTTGDYVLTLKNIKDAAGNTLVKDADKQVVKLEENVAPVAKTVTLKSSAEAVVTFSEAVQFNDLDNDGVMDGIIVKVNGQPVVATIGSPSGESLSINGLNLKATDTISVEFKSAEIADMSANKNALKDSVIK